MRKHYIDNLKWLIILLLVPYHAAMAWNTWGEPNYILFESNRLVSSIIAFLSPYFMPILFLLAGMSTNFALRKRTVGQYILERCKKLLLPFLLGTVLLLPIMTYIADVFNCGYQGNFFQHYRIFFTKFTDLTGADGGFSVGQFWFLLYLFVISVIAVDIIAVQKKIKPKFKTEIPLLGICLLGLPILFLSELISIGGKSLAEYLYIFLIGYYVFAEDSAVDKTEKYKWFFLCVGLIASVLNAYMFVWSETQYPLLNTVTMFVSEWFMLLALLGIGKRYFNFNGRISEYLSHRSFAFYILHYIWIVSFQYFMSGICGSSTVLLYVVPVFLAYGATFLCYEICVRVPFLCYLMGKKR